MSLASVLLSGRDWLLPSAALALAALGVLVWSYRRSAGQVTVRHACFALKLLGFLALAACLLEPLWTVQRARPGANLVALVADNSQGLQLRDAGEMQSRGELLRRLLTDPAAAWPAVLEENFQTRRYTFDNRLQAVRDFGELAFDGRSSALRGALRTLRERFANRPLAAVLLFSDGNATDLGDDTLDLSGLPPVYPVVIGREGLIRDVSLQNVTVTPTAFEDAPVTVTAEVLSPGFVGASLVARLLDAAGRPVQEQTQTTGKDGQPTIFRFNFRPERAGLSFHRVTVFPKDAPADGAGEATLANNRRDIVVDRGRGPYRILYVAGRPNWEFKFLNRALAEDEQVQLVALLRVAKREAKFDFKGRKGESSNPLFRGFGNQSKEEVERYDQPVFIRLNTRDELELKGGFPKVPEDLFGYHAVILDDLEAEFFGPDQMALLQRFVSERGGGFLMLGGAESFQDGKYARTPVGDMLPLYLDRAPAAEAGAARMALSREGWLQPWVRLRMNEADEKSRLKAMPDFRVLNRVAEAKPGASVLAMVADGDGHQFPALLAQRFGHGRTAALTVGDFWRWGFQDENSHRDMDKSWRQLIRWLVSDVPARTEVQVVRKADDASGAVRLLVRARDKKFQPLENATVALQIRTFTHDATATNGTLAGLLNTRTNIVRLQTEPSASEPGVFESAFVPRDPGAYLAEAVVTDSQGAEAGRAEAGWTTDFAAEEFRSLQPNRSLLAEIARKTGGEIIPAEKLGEFARGLPNRKAPITEAVTLPLWNQPLVFLLALFCFVAEWGLRRWKGLP